MIDDADFVPIDAAAKDGNRQLVRRGSTYAAAQWTGDFWSEPYGPGKMEADTPCQLNFEPTHYAKREDEHGGA
jgi:hypothetical protein